MPVVTETPTPTTTPVESPSATATEVTSTPEPTQTTATGGELPKTSTPWGNLGLLGGALVVVGALGYRFRKVFAR